MIPANMAYVFIPAAALLGCFFYLLHCTRKNRQLIGLVGIFCLAMGLFLLVLDLVLITLIHGPQYIANSRFEPPNGLPVLPNHPDSLLPLSWRLSTPNGLEQEEIPQIDLTRIMNEMGQEGWELVGNVSF